ncbi:MAG: alpha/beta hydrolase [Pseudomonadota bacterium]
MDDYLHDGLDRVDGGDADAVDQMWKLLCEPAWEADTFAAQRNRPWQALKRIKKFGVPTSILVASRGSVMTEDTIERIHKVFPDAQIKQLAGTSHFLPMEAPYAVRDEISNYLSRLVEGFNAVDEGPVRRTLEA